MSQTVAPRDGALKRWLDSDLWYSFTRSPITVASAITALIPVGVARMTGSPSSIARSRACARCWAISRWPGASAAACCNRSLAAAPRPRARNIAQP